MALRPVEGLHGEYWVGQGETRLLGAFRNMADTITLSASGDDDEAALALTDDEARELIGILQGIIDGKEVEPCPVAGNK